MVFRVTEHIYQTRAGIKVLHLVNGVSYSADNNGKIGTKKKHSLHRQSIPSKLMSLAGVQVGIRFQAQLARMKWTICSAECSGQSPPAALSYMKNARMQITDICDVGTGTFQSFFFPLVQITSVTLAEERALAVS